MPAWAAKEPQQCSAAALVAERGPGGPKRSPRAGRAGLPSRPFRAALCPDSGLGTVRGLGRAARGALNRALGGPRGGRRRAFVRGRSGAPPLPPANPPRWPGRTQPPGPGERVSTPPGTWSPEGRAAAAPSAGHAFFRLPQPGPGPGLAEVTWGAAGRAREALGAGKGAVGRVACGGGGGGPRAEGAVGPGRRRRRGRGASPASPGPAPVTGPASESPPRLCPQAAARGLGCPRARSRRASGRLGRRSRVHDRDPRARDSRRRHRHRRHRPSALSPLAARAH